MRLTRSAIIIMLLSLYGSVLAQNTVSEREALSVAISVAKNQRNNGTVESIKKMTGVNDRPILYEIIMVDSSAVLLSGNKACTPLLGEYKFSGISIVDDFEMIPCGLKCLVNSYIRQINQCFESEGPIEDNLQWDLFVRGADSIFENRSSVEPILRSKWGQYRSNDGLDNTAYNEFAPDSGCTYGSSHCPAGCVAVAMGQIMYYWKYPFFISYDNDVFNWCNMSNELRIDNPCYEYKKVAINSLLKACAESVNMIYDCQGSGTSASLALNAFKTVFHYASNISSYSYLDYNYNIATMSNKIVYDLDSGNLVLMRAVDPEYGGHAFVCDGYNRRGKVHINWGWTGNFDGYYQIDNLSPNNYSFSEQYGIIYKIKPDIIYYTENNVQLDAFYSNYLTSDYQPYRLVPSQSNKLYSAPIYSLSSWRTIPENATSIYQAHEEVILQPGFTAEYGSDFTARIEPCEACEERMVQMDILLEGDTSSDIDTSDLNMRMLKSGDTSFVFRPSALMLFPNPSTQTLTVQTYGDINDLQIFDQSGRPVFRWFVESRSNTEITLNIGDIPVGTYILRIIDKDRKMHIGRFVKK